MAISILARVYNYYSYYHIDIYIASIYNRDLLHSYHSCDTQYPHSVMHGILLSVHLKLCYCELLLEKTILISSIEYPWCCWDLWSGTCVFWTPWGHSYISVLIIKVNLYVKVPFMTMRNYVCGLCYFQVSD